MKHGQGLVEVRLRIHELAPTGEGVGLVLRAGDNRAVFVPRAALGDELLVAADFSRKPARGQIRSILTASSSRAEPPCEAFERCGGCDWMHLSRDTQLDAHAAHVKLALPDGADLVVVRAGTLLRYRTRARLHVKASGGRAVVGFMAGESHAPVEVASCVVLHPSLDHARAFVAGLFDGASGEGEARLTRGAFPDRKPVLSVSWSRELPATVYARAEALVSEGALGGVRFSCGESARPSVVGDATPWMDGADAQPLELGPAGFAQASEEMNGRLARAVGEAVGGGSRVLELYAGAGNFTMVLARNNEKLVAVELDSASCEASRRNLKRRDLTATVRAADVACQEIPKNVDVVVLDPPRAGAANIAAALTAVTHVKRVVYVSCDTRTLARDLETLAPRYAFERATVFEMFPHTSHCETMVVLKRRRK